MKLSTILTSALIAVASLSVLNVSAQKERKSPMKTTEATVGDAKVTITYSSPSVKGRTIFGDLVPYDKVWRTGANEAATIETTAEIAIGGKMLGAGKYSLFTIPSAKTWTIIINSVPDQWGAYKYDASKDVFRVPSAKIEQVDSIEQFEINIEDGMLSFGWSTTKASVSIK